MNLLIALLLITSVGQAPFVSDFTGIESIGNGSPAYGFEVFPRHLFQKWTYVNQPDIAVHQFLYRWGEEFICAADYIDDAHFNYAITFISGDLLKIYVNSEFEVIGKLGKLSPDDYWTGMASNGKTMYLTSIDYYRSVLYTVDVNNALTTVVGIINAPAIIDIAYADGYLYGVDIESDVLYKIDPSTAESWAIGDIGFNANFAQDIDYNDGTMYLTTFNIDAMRGELRTVDLNTGMTQLIGALPHNSEVDGFYILHMTSNYLPAVHK